MDKIYFNGMAFYGYHGVFQEEARLGQRFYVDLELSLDLQKAADTDQLEYTVNYADIYERVKAIIEGERYQLVEKLTAQICDGLLSDFPLDEVKVKVTKPDPPIAGHYQSVAIEMIRKKGSN